MQNSFKIVKSIYRKAEADLMPSVVVDVRYVLAPFHSTNYKRLTKKLHSLGDEYIRYKLVYLRTRCWSVNIVPFRSLNNSSVYILYGALWHGAFKLVDKCNRVALGRGHFYPKGMI